MHDGFGRTIRSTARRLSVLAVAAAVGLQTGCAAPGKPGQITQETRSSVGHVAVVGARFDPKYNFEALSKEAAGAQGASEANRVCDQLLRSGGDAASVALAGIAFLICLPVASTAGYSSSVSKAPTAEQLADARAAAQRAVSELGLQERAVAAAARYGNEYGRGLRTLAASTGPATVESSPAYAQAATEGADTLIEISVLNVTSETTGMKELPVWLFMDARVRVIRASDNTQLDTFTVRYFGGARPIEEWLADGGKGIRTELERGVNELTEQAMDEVLLIYRPAPQTSAPAASSGSSKPAGAQVPPAARRGLVPPYALRPLDPPVRNKLYGPSRMTYGHLERYALPDLQPTFQWEAFPPGLGIAQGAAPNMAGDVRYDFRIFSATGGIAYERRGLDAPRHRLEQPLEPCHSYRWTVRARFALGEVGYVTEWTGAFDTLGGQTEPSWWRRAGGAPPLAMIPARVLLMYPIIETPAVNAKACPD